MAGKHFAVNSLIFRYIADYAAEHPGIAFPQSSPDQAPG